MGLKATLSILGLVLAGCQAEDLNIDIASDELLSAAAGNTVYLEFDAEIGEESTSIDDEKRATISAIESVFSKYFPDADIETEIESDSYKIEIEGEMPLSAKSPTNGTPWFVQIKEIDSEKYLVRLMPSSTFGALKAEMNDINMMIGPDEFQGVDFKITGASGRLTFGGAYLDGEPVAVSDFSFDGEKHTLSFKDGIWSKTAAGFYFSVR